ncbi:MAG TPA: FAD-binding oxidoreductase [Paracoccaceae bacterium]|nr:FAD-binding oxidoreductase [Paracoccaceae bacterium]
MQWKKTRISGWGRVLTAAQSVARPERLSALKDLPPAPAFGNLRSYGDAPLNGGGQGIDMTRMDRFLAFDPKTGVLDVEAGVSIIDILRTFGPKGWMPSVMPGTGFATVGGCIANDVHGKNHHGAGSFGQYVESLVLVGANGKSRRVSAERESAVFHATLGGLGQTGVIHSARLQLTPCLGGKMRVTDRRIGDIHTFVDALESSTAPYAVGWIDATATGAEIGRGTLEEGAFLPDSIFSPPAKRKSVPFNAPGFTLAPTIVRLFNAYYISRTSVAGRHRMRTLEEFFFPLDAIRNWNRLYGKKGFYQFQCVIPMEGATEVLTEMLKRVERSGLVSPLAVLKKLGPGRAGPMSFPMEGMTLALDLPNRASTLDVLTRLEALTLEANGRVYLAKDANTSPAAIPAMYPERAAFAEVVNRVDPEGKFETDLVRRLGLRG